MHNREKGSRFAGRNSIDMSIDNPTINGDKKNSGEDEVGGLDDSKNDINIQMNRTNNFSKASTKHDGSSALANYAE